MAAHNIQEYGSRLSLRLLKNGRKFRQNSFIKELNLISTAVETDNLIRQKRQGRTCLIISILRRYPPGTHSCGIKHFHYRQLFVRTLQRQQKTLRMRCRGIRRSTNHIGKYEELALSGVHERGSATRISIIAMMTAYGRFPYNHYQCHRSLSSSDNRVLLQYLLYILRCKRGHSPLFLQILLICNIGLINRIILPCFLRRSDSYEYQRSRKKQTEKSHAFFPCTGRGVLIKARIKGIGTLQHNATATNVFHVT